MCVCHCVIIFVSASESHFRLDLWVMVDQLKVQV